MTKMKIASIG